MILDILAFLVPHFITRYLVLDKYHNLIGVYHGMKIGNRIAIEYEGDPVAGPGTIIDISLGISWFGYAIFFWVKESYSYVGPKDC